MLMLKVRLNRDCDMWVFLKWSGMVRLDGG